ncbi:DedA family protein [Flindersiella endophytica]
MSDAVLEVATSVLRSPWFYLVLFTLVYVDAFLPGIPSEGVVVVAGVFAVTGTPELPLVMLVAMVAAFAGDHTSLLIGRLAGTRLMRWIPEGSRRRRTLDWSARQLERRGAQILIIGRYVPGGRTGVTLMAGFVGYPLRSFAPYVAVAAVTWGIYSSLVGYLGGLVFRDHPWRGVAAGIGFGIAVTMVVELVRFIRRRRSRATAEPAVEPV